MTVPLFLRYYSLSHMQDLMSTVRNPSTSCGAHIVSVMLPIVSM